jgi:exodeoxyribonuclease VII small subunit
MSSPAVIDPAAVPAPSFEEAMERLEGIVEQMENARLPLEDLIRGYEEGTRLIKICSDRLNAAEQRIEIITRDAAGQPAPVAPAALASASAAPPKPARAPKAAQEPAAPSQTPNPHEVSLF